MNETLDDLLTESGDEEESDAVVNQVLDEIGIEISNKVSHVHGIFNRVGPIYEIYLKKLSLCTKSPILAVPCNPMRCLLCFVGWKPFRSFGQLQGSGIYG